ncbi:MAG: D-glycero-beta-D-manno-heptose 1,7-bisphosphate 7-phosphatase [Candidatus Saganbacteria bacterium]|nr:D-glycero-beta-D-manno-heptose 1,7-bisphosphate 7-phosphatase [Candidatus Saganbacteria bacterium]
MSAKSKAVFLDRDGTLIEDSGYISSPDQIKFIPGAIEAVKRLNEAGYKVVIISNQAGVARGLLAENMLQTIDKIIHREVLSGGGHIDASYYCPHHPEHGVYPYKQACECRKPHPGMLKRAVREKDLELAGSFMIGDKSSDIETGKRAGTKTVFVRTGHGRDEEKKLKEKPDHTADNLAAAARWILNGKN